MSWEPVPVSDSDEKPSIMAAVDPDADGKRLVIADVEREESWVSTPVEAAAALADWQ